MSLLAAVLRLLQLVLVERTERLAAQPSRNRGELQRC